MSYKLLKKLDNGVRIGELTTPHGKISTPFFMPVGTVGSVKGVSPKELDELGAQIILSNTYHLYLRPGEQLIKKLGGLHRFMGWEKPILTDSGGYQVFSLGENKYQISNIKYQKNSKLQIINSQTSLVKISDDGVEFKSHLDGSKHMFTPEKVIQIQLDLGVDILMPLDVCPSGKATKEEVRRACELTIAWAKRSKKYFEEQISKSEFLTLPTGRQVSNQIPNSKILKFNENCPEGHPKGEKLSSTLREEPSCSDSNEKIENSKANRPLLHGIVQGGLYSDLRKWCAEELIKLNFDGYSVGGLAVDLETRKMWEVVKLMGEILPEDKQRYLMGVGTPDDIIKATTLGMDMFDCVLPTRMARHGSVYIKNQKQKTKNQKYDLINLLNSEYRIDEKVIDENCGCYACQNGEGFSKAYISHLLRSGEILGIRLTTLHNLYQYLELMRELRG